MVQYLTRIILFMAKVIVDVIGQWADMIVMMRLKLLWIRYDTKLKIVIVYKAFKSTTHQEEALVVDWVAQLLKEYQILEVRLFMIILFYQILICIINKNSIIMSCFHCNILQNIQIYQPYLIIKRLIIMVDKKHKTNSQNNKK